MTQFTQKWTKVTSAVPPLFSLVDEDNRTICNGLYETEANHIVEVHNLWLSMMRQPSQGTLTHESETEIRMGAEETKILLDHHKLENVRLEQEIRSLQIENETAALHLKHEELTYKQREDRQKTNTGSSSSTSTPKPESSTDAIASLARQMTSFQSWMQVATLTSLRNTMPSDDWVKARKILTDLPSYVVGPLPEVL
jgi:hypothetical protein